ncbi:hypothetical protein QPK32_00950 [Massilia sp. YIM B02763]|uniref:hypothetical protein n=1 Tax=Massilia sp. YIM B02763 TaxID=3050130 RepID=UPI0025B6CB88|nr:hypothetical protein [Massilia sp. YIM B02763]MDN4051650.1 hypothetical protein [Massilia sp. YIM B02763]
MPESTRLDVRKIGWGACAILCGIAFAVAGAWLLLRATGPAANTPPHAITAPAPRLQTAPVPERAAYFAEKERLTSGYAWVDREAGIARIPLAEAMRITAARAAKKEDGR